MGTRPSQQDGAEASSGGVPAHLVDAPSPQPTARKGRVDLRDAQRQRRPPGGPPALQPLDGSAKGVRHGPGRGIGCGRGRGKHGSARYRTKTVIVNRVSPSPCSVGGRTRSGRGANGVERKGAGPNGGVEAGGRGDVGGGDGGGAAGGGAAPLSASDAPVRGGGRRCCNPPAAGPEVKPGAGAGGAGAGAGSGGGPVAGRFRTAVAGGARAAALWRARERRDGPRVAGGGGSVEAQAQAGEAPEPAAAACGAGRVGAVGQLDPPVAGGAGAGRPRGARRSSGRAPPVAAGRRSRSPVRGRLRGSWDTTSRCAGRTPSGRSGRRRPWRPGVRPGSRIVVERRLSGELRLRHGGRYLAARALGAARPAPPRRHGRVVWSGAVTRPAPGLPGLASKPRACTVLRGLRGGPGATHYHTKGRTFLLWPTPGHFYFGLTAYGPSVDSRRRPSIFRPPNGPVAQVVRAHA